MLISTLNLPTRQKWFFYFRLSELFGFLPSGATQGFLPCARPQRHSTMWRALCSLLRSGSVSHSKMSVRGIALEGARPGSLRTSCHQWSRRTTALYIGIAAGVCLTGLCARWFLISDWSSCTRPFLPLPMLCGQDAMPRMFCPCHIPRWWSGSEIHRSIEAIPNDQSAMQSLRLLCS